MEIEITSTGLLILIYQRKWLRVLVINKATYYANGNKNTLQLTTVMYDNEASSFRNKNIKLSTQKYTK